MRKTFKKYFIPEAANDYKPHFFRETSIVALALLITFIFFIGIAHKLILEQSDLTAAILPRVLVDLANGDRMGNSLNTLAINSVLEEAARLKAEDMAAKGYFAHKSPDGHTPWYWFRLAGYDFFYAGENLAVDFNDSIDVDRAWMNSPGHRANILNNNFTEIGIATAKGNYQGRETIFVVQMFGQPLITNTVSPATSTAIKIATSTIAKAATSTRVTTTPRVTATTTLTTVASSSVLSASGENELFIAVENSDAIKSQNKIIVLAAPQYTSLLERLFVNPRMLLHYTYSFLAFIIIISLSLMIFIEIKKQHPLHIFFGVSLLILISALSYIYQTFIFTDVLIR